MKNVLIVFMPLLIVVSLFSMVYFFSFNNHALTFFVYLGFWVSASLWITALSSKKIADA